MNWYTRSESWTFIVRRFLPRLTLCSLAWEIGQLPLYSLWEEPRLGSIVFALAHCTVGDAMIGTAALIIALILSGAGELAGWPKLKLGLLMALLAVAYTLLSERVNLSRGNWAYSEWMPVLPWVEVGLAPVLQWIVVPLVAWWWTNRLLFHVHRLK
jgi:hypothetical protein